MAGTVDDAAAGGALTLGEIEVEPLTFRIGAEIQGVDLSQDLSDDAIAQVRAALLRHRVIFFRDQRIDADDHLRFASRFGELTAAHPTLAAAADHSHVLELDSLTGGRADGWHTDVTFLDRPPTFSVLRSVVIPPYGGDTIWASTAAAYAHLPETLRTLADGLRAVHTNANDYAAAPPVYADEATRLHEEEFVSTVYEAEHPVVRVHPETGERCLLLGGFAQWIAGLSGRESRQIIQMLQDRVPTPENTVRWHWREGDVAMWDNRSTQHYAVNDYGNVRRVVKRITVAGAIPVGIDGRPSVAVRGDAADYSVVGAY